MKPTKILLLILTLSFTSSCITTESDLSSILGTTSTALELVSGLTYSDQQATAEGFKAAEELDKKNKLAPKNNKYTKRLKRLLKNHLEEDNLNLNFKVYLTPQINAFALPNGDIRIYQGLMDLMTDDEILFVIGHEIGHIKHKHAKEKQRLAKTTIAAFKGLSLHQNTKAIANSTWAQLGANAINSQFSQKEELEADTYGLHFMDKHQYDTDAAVSALRKLARSGKKQNMVESFFASHPDALKRAQRIKSMLNNSL
jgi:putative metalloprotease